MHIGGARTLLFNYLFARSQGGALVLRIEDTDAARSARDLAERMMDTIEWLGLSVDEGPRQGGPCGPYFQSERNERHRRRVESLLAAGRAYLCYCTPEELARRREAALAEGRPPRYDGRCRDLPAALRLRYEAEGRRPAVRLRVPEEGTTVVPDLVKGPVAFDHAELDDFVIQRSDGVATYNLAAVVDDADMGITHVLRADEHLSNTPKQILLYRALDEPVPAFAHLPMVLAPDRSKLSKRHGAVSVEEFRERGFLPEAIVNYAALLGWSPPDGRELLTLAELEALFSLDRVSRTAAVYDVAKMEWLNAQHLRRLPAGEILARARPWLDAAGLAPEGTAPEAEERLQAAVELVRERVRTLAEVPQAVAWCLSAPEAYDDAGVRRHFADPGAAERLSRAAQLLSGLSDWSPAAIEAAYRSEAEKRGEKAALWIHATRLALTGRTVGPGLFELAACLPKEEAVRRLERAAAYVRAGRVPVAG